MKARFLPAMIVAALCCGAQFHGPLRAEEFDPFEDDESGFELSTDSSVQTRVQVEFIELPHELMSGLMFGAKPAADDAELRARIQTLIGEGKASIAETLMVMAPNGTKAHTASHEEFIYPTEYEPAELPTTLNIDGKEVPANESPLRRNFATGPTPTAFETRNLGSTLEVTPQVTANRERVHLELVAEIVHHQGNRIYAEWKGTFGDSPVQMPMITSHRVNTKVILAAGRPMLVGVLSPRGEDGFPDFTRKWMVFAKADVIPSGDKKSE